MVRSKLFNVMFDRWLWVLTALVRLGTSGLKVSRIILGCMSYGSPEWYSWVLPEEEGLKHIKAAWVFVSRSNQHLLTGNYGRRYDAGINAFDTANVTLFLCLVSRWVLKHDRFIPTVSPKPFLGRLSRSTTSLAMKLWFLLRWLHHEIVLLPWY